VKLHVVVPAFNCMDYLPQCLASIATQGRLADTVTIIDDASTDPEQAAYLRRAVLEDMSAGREGRWRVVFNDRNQEVARNLWEYHQALDPAPDDVIVEVDGDDRLAPGALARIAGAYAADPDVWLTYGSYEYWPDPGYWDNPALPYPPEVVSAASYRTHRVLFNHPETWRAFLWQRLTEADLQDDLGRWVRRTWDYTVMMPLLEMAGTHWRHLPDVNYLYTHTNPASHVRIPEHTAEAEAEAHDIRRRPPKLPVPDEHIANPRRKRDLLVSLAKRYGMHDVIETGTGMGDLAEWLRHAFRNVWTVELDDASHQRCLARFAGVENVMLYPGDSSLFVAKFAQRGPHLFFLDAHYSGPGTAKGVTDTPVREELAAIYADGLDHVAVIDDARLFGTDPAYPSPLEVGVLVSPRYVSFVDDMIVITPDPL